MTSRAAAINHATWQRLLGYLCPNVGDIGGSLRRIHGKVVTFFRWQGIEGGRELADKTFERVARRMAANEPLPGQPWSFVLAVARTIAAEEKAKLRAPPQPGRGPRASVLDESLAVLTPSERDLFERYFAEERSKLAHELGTSIGTLRIKTFRVRAKLERDMTMRMGRP